MKSLRTVRYSLIAAAVAGAAVVSTPASAEVSATAGIASAYLWRGVELGTGTPAVFGSLDYTHESGLFAGVWGSSGDTASGSEVDLYAGYAFSSDAFGFKVTAYDYSYPRFSAAKGDLQEVVVGVTASGFFADAVIGVADLQKNYYYDAGYTMDKYTAKVGMMNPKGAANNYTHVDLSYAFNSNLAFTVSGIVDAETGGPADQDALFVVAYTIPLK